MTLRVFSYGGGWQSNTALVLAAQGKIDFRTFLFANVGDDSEKPETLAYVRKIAMPYARDHGIDLIEVQRQWKDGRAFESIYRKIMDCPDGVLREPIPVRGQNGMPLSRSCTVDWKVKVTGQWCQEHGATADDPVIKALGYTSDEAGRINTALALPFEILTYPLVSAPIGYDTGLHLRRSDCPAIIRSAGLPLPPKSHCWMCPMHSVEEWRTELRDHPDRFAKSVEMEALMIDRRRRLGKPPVFLTRFGKPLDQVVRDGADLLPLLDEQGSSCDASGCFT